jgi:hypothetical protein
MRILHAVPDREDIERIKKGFEDLSKADPETRKKFWTEVGLFDKDGNVAEPYKDLLPEKA